MKKFLICLSLLFSFTFITNIKAVNYQGIDVDYVLNKLWNYANGKDIKELNSSSKYTGTVLKSQYPYVSITKSTLGPYVGIRFYKNVNDYSTLDNYGSFNIYSSNYKNFFVVNYNSNNDTFTYFDFATDKYSNKYWDRVYSSYSSYYSSYSSFTNFTIANRITKSFDYSATPFVFNFHLNGGWVRDPRDNWGSEEDFSFTLYPNEVEEFITNLEVNKLTMVFDGWYYDSKFNHPFNISDSINDDVDLYAKFRYEKVDDFLKNTTFNQYTFDTLYDYAIITKGNNSGDIYLGLNVNKYDITVYEYKENLLSYDNERGFCLTPMYSKNGTYYYLLDTTKTLDTEVLVLPKSTFENNNYDFLLTDNAYITYTNNLEETTIYDSSGNQITTNLQDTYQRFQDSMIDDETDLLTIFKKLINLKDNNIFNNITVIWNKLKSTAIYNYLMILIVGGLIILIVKSAKRK